MDLRNIVGLKEDEIEKLSKNWITTAEEFASIYFNQTLSDNLQKLLNTSTLRYNEISEVIIKSLTETKINEIKRIKNTENKTGAKRPIK